MQYLSTRGGAPAADFIDVLTAGLAPDGGLYVPAAWPALSQEKIAAFSGAPYGEVCADILSHFVGEAFSHAQLAAMANDVYGQFNHPEIAPLTQVGEEDWILELFHGPTLAFKDFAMQLLGKLFDAALEARGERLTIVAATSGDTGAAAIHALAPCRHVDVVVLHPYGRVTDVQRRMMTCVDAPNVLNIAVDGDFDACQAIVKTLFADRAFARKVALSGVNSINWARLAAQTVYYFTASAALGARDRPINFIVPTGNFGDVFAGYVAKRMGLNVAMLGVAANANDILHRAISSGDYSSMTVRATNSPSMDIQVASNFERLLFDALGRDADATRAVMKAFAQDRRLALSSAVTQKIAGDFVSGAADEAATKAEIARHYAETGALIDPHTAVARHVARNLRQSGAIEGRTVTLSTAHPAKFPDAVMEATGIHPDLPTAYHDLFERPETMERAPNDAGAIAKLMTSRFSKD